MDGNYSLIENFVEDLLGCPARQRPRPTKITMTITTKKNE